MIRPMEHNNITRQKNLLKNIELAKDVNSAELIVRLQQFLAAGPTLQQIGSGPGTDFGLLHDHYDLNGSDFSAVFVSHLKAS